MAHRKTTKHSKARSMLRLADLEQSKNAVLHSLGAASSQESYGHAIDEFIGWYCSEPRLHWLDARRSSFLPGARISSHFDWDQGASEDRVEGNAAVVDDGGNVTFGYATTLRESAGDKRQPPALRGPRR